MKHLKLFFALFAMLALGVGNAWGADCDYSDDFSTVNVNTSYSTRATTEGWNATYTAVENYTYNSKSYRAFKMNGKKGGLGKITSPLFSDGCSAISFVYGQAHKDAIKFDVKIYDKNNVELFSKSYSASKPSAAPTAGVLVEETITGVEGDFYVVFANTSTSTSTSNGYRVSIMNVCITSAGSGSTEPALSSIEISGDLTNKTYEEGDELDLTGLTVLANYESGDPKDVTNEVEWSYTPNPLTKGTTSVVVTATYEDKTATQTVNDLTVNEHIITPGEHCITPNNDFWGTNYTGTDANAATTLSGKQDDISILHTKSGSNLYVNDSQTRVYENHTMKISVPLGYVITAVVFTADGTNWKGTHTADVGEMTDSKTWTGANQNVTITFGGTCRITNICVTYIKDVKYALTITEPTEGGTLVVKDGENTLASGAEIYEGTKLTVTATPATGYEDGVVVVKNASDEDVTADVYEAGTLTMPAYAVTISATFEKKPCTLLNTPVVTATPTYNSATLTWAAVANAAKYSVTVGETTTEVTEPTFTATGLNAETTYTYQVQAIAEAEQDTYCDSEVAEGLFTTTTAPVATLTLSDIEGTTTQTGALNGTITLPTTAAECSKTFVGWDADENCNHAPTYAPGAEYTLAAETQTLYAVYADGEEGELINVFTETFDACNGTGGNDNKWSGSIASGTLSLADWELIKGSPADGCAKFGTGSVKGSAETPAITLTGAATLTFRAAAWSGDSKTLNLSATGATLGEASVTLKDAEWTEYTIAITGATGSVKIKFEAKNTSSNRFFLDDVVVSQTSVNYSNYSTTCAAAPIATVDPTSVTATAAGVNGTLEVSYENVNTEIVSVALYNDEACTEAFTDGWLTAALDGDKNIAYTVAATTLYTERKAYIQLTAPDAAAATDPAVVVIPVTQAGKDKVFASLADLLANITPTTDATKVTVTLTKEPIVDIYVSGNYRNGIFLNVPYQGTTKEIEIYSRDVPAEWVAGGSVSGTLTNCDWKVYNGIWELCPADWSELTYQEPKAVSTVVVSGAPTKTTYVDGEAFDPAGLTVTVNYNDATTEVNPTGVTFDVTPATLTKGETAVSVTATFNSVTSEVYTVNNLIVTDIQSMTILDFITSGGTRCYLEGIVSNITNTTYGNFDLTDESGTIYVYGCLNAAGESQKFADLGVKNGDKIKVIANESSLYNGITQTKDVQYVSHKSAATIEVADIAMKVGETQDISAIVIVTPEDASVSYAIKEGSDDCIDLNDAEIYAKEAGTATIVATIEGTADYMGAEKEFTVTITAPDTRKKAVSPSPFTTVSGDMDPNDITYTSSKGGGTGGPNINENYIQLYQIASGQSYGGFITFNAVKGCKIDQVKIVTGNTTTTHIAYSVNDVMSATTEDVQENAEYLTETGLNAESVNIYCMHTDKKNRLFIASAIVYYTGQPLADPEISWTSNAVELQVGEAFTAPTLNNPYNVKGITYDSDNESLAMVNESTGAVTLVPDATGTATITATFAGDGTYKAVKVSYTITVNPALVSGVWELVTDHTSLASGDKVVIVAKEYEKALSTTQNSNNRGQAAVIKNNNTISFSADVQVLTLETGSKENTFALNTGNGYLYASSTSSNQLKTQAKKDDNASWNILIENGTASIVAQGTNSRSTMQYNQSSSLFACYSSASQQALCLYMKKNVKVVGETDNTSIPNQSDVTVDNAELTVTTEAEYDNMYIGNNGSVDVEETVTVNNLYIQTTMGTTTSGQLNTAPENIIVNGDAFIDITLGKNAEGKNGDPNQWHAFTVPFPVDAMNGVYDLNDKKLTNGVNYAIMQYHGDVRAQGKYGWKKYSGVLVPGTFYLMTVDGERTTYRFKKVKDAALVAENIKSLSAYTGGGKTTDYGWNGVGNPTLMHGKVAYNAQILDPVSYTYVTVPATSSAHFTVGTPFFIQAKTDGTMTMVAETSASIAPARRAAAAVDQVKVMLGNADYTDYLYVSASEDATNEYEIGKDLAKMTMTNTPIVPQIFAQAYGTYLCMVNAPMTSNEATVALNLYAPAEGEYTLSVEEQADATVYLLYNGNIVWNLSMGEYPIHLTQGNNAGYSLVVRRENAPTDVENIFGADEQIEKFIYNGNLYILHEGKVFDAVGNVLK